jgi:hypothetical protein
MFDILSKLDTLEQSGLKYDKLYLGEIKHPFQKSTLEALNIPQDKIILGGRWTQLSTKTLIIPELPMKDLDVAHFAIDFLKSRLTPEICINF